MNAALRALALALAAAGLVAELRAVLAAPGVALILGGCAAAYIWFVAVARSARTVAVARPERAPGRSS